MRLAQHASPGSKGLSLAPDLDEAVILTRQVGVHTDYTPGGVVKFRSQLNEPLDPNEMALHVNQPDRPMPFQMTVGLLVLDHEKYAQYRAEIAPLLAATGARFRYDFEV